jgi:hypothetical protein
MEKLHSIKNFNPPKKRQNKAKEEGFCVELACLFACLFILRNQCAKRWIIMEFFTSKILVFLDMKMRKKKKSC